jgi:ribosome recycling factor
MSDEILLEMSEKMENSMEAFRKDLSKVRTGRASLSLLDGVKVDSYGALSPLNQVATLTTPESRLIVIQPWDPQVLPSIEKAILKR